MLLFRSEEHIERWCRARGVERGATLSLKQIWGLAQAFYGTRLHPDARRPTRDEIRATFARLDLVGPFWEV